MPDPRAGACADVDADVKRRVDAVLREFVVTETDLLVAIDPQLKPVAQQLWAAVADGKRLRAAFCYWGWRAAGQPESDCVVRAAAAMELVHAAAVVHDDLIDDSALRRGAPTAHVALRDAFADRPDGAAQARSLAMLVGDLLMSWAGQLFAGCGLPGAYLGRARELWATLGRELVAGECMELLRTRGAPCADSSLEIVRYKTGSYTVEHPLRLGGVLAGAAPALLDAFAAYARPLGEAFQLRDDLLGIFGEPDETGKSNLDDLAGAKPTALLALALDGAAPEDAKRLRALLGRSDLGPADLATARAVMERSGARARVEAMIEQRRSASLDAVAAGIATADLTPLAADALIRLAAAATFRSN